VFFSTADPKIVAVPDPTCFGSTNTITFPSTFIDPEPINGFENTSVAPLSDTLTYPYGNNGVSKVIKL